MAARVHAAAVVAQIRATFEKSYDVDEVPPKPDYPIIEVTLDTSRPASYRHSGEASGGAWRLVTSYYGTTADEARICAEKAATALLGKHVAIAGFKTTKVRLESSQPVVPDDDFADSGLRLYSGSSVWAFSSQPV